MPCHNSTVALMRPHDNTASATGLWVRISMLGCREVADCPCTHGFFRID